VWESDVELAILSSALYGAAKEKLTESSTTMKNAEILFIKIPPIEADCKSKFSFHQSIALHHYSYSGNTYRQRQPFNE